MLNVKELSERVVHIVAEPDQADDLSREAARIADGRDDTGHLAITETIILAGLAIQVCTIAVESARLVDGFFQRDKDKQLHLILSELAKQSGDSSAALDPTVQRFAEAACTVLNETR